MECNRDEALRAKEIAEKKLASQDYDGARKFLQKALQLFPALENTAQMSAVLDVHIAAQAKINGAETDWYGILQVDHRAEDILIKKQYKKLALLLHPDKNKLSGAEAAFKLIGEALQVLSDKVQRSLHDSRRKQVSKSGSSGQRSQNQHGTAAPFTNRPNTTATLTFMTICPVCHTRFQYYRLYENHNVLCQQCHTPFIAREYLAGPNNGSYSAYVWQQQYPHHQPPFNGSFQHYPTSSSFHTNQPSVYGNKIGDPTNKVFKEKEDVDVTSGTKRKRNDETEKEMRKMEREKQKKAKADQKVQEAMEKMKKRKKRQKRNSDSSSDDDEDDGGDDEDVTGDSMDNQSDDQFVNQANGSNAAPRRSSRPRRNVTYKVDESDDDEVQPSGTKVEEKDESSKEGENCSQNVDSVDVKEKQNLANLFKIRIRQNLNLQNEIGPDNASGVGSNAEEIKAEPNLTAENVTRQDGSGINKVTIKTSVNKTSPDAGNVADIDAEKVEANTNTNVKVDDEGAVLQGDCFSPMLNECLEKKENGIESSKLDESSRKAKERTDDTYGRSGQRVKACSNEESESRGTMLEEKEFDREINEEELEEDGLKVPDADFYNFDHEREEKDVAVGQIWAAYDDNEGLPRYYFRVKEVISRVPFKISITWLEMRNMNDEQRALQDLGCYPVCGAYFRSPSPQTLESVCMFSHILKWEKGPKGAIKIYPRKGEIWAVFRGRKPGLRARRKNAYDMVEVLGDFNEQAGVSVVFLEKLTEYKTVFKCTKNYLDISAANVCRFSYQVPAHKLLGTEAPGIQEGFWELDPAAVPNDLILQSGVK